MRIYGILISLAILVSVYIIESRLKKLKVDLNSYWNLILVVIVSALTGARLYHVLSDLEYYLADPIQIIFIYQGGMAIYGGLLGGLIGAYLFLKRRNRKKDFPSFLFWMDQFSTVVPLAQGIGRFGNFFNYELYGPPTNYFLGIYIPPQYRLAGYENFEKFHPLFAYEAFFDLLIFTLLNFLSKNPKFAFGTGKLFSLYLVLYSGVRFFLETLRINSWKIYEVNVAQVFSLIIIFSVFYWRLSLKKV